MYPFGNNVSNEFYNLPASNNTSTAVVVVPQDQFYVMQQPPRPGRFQPTLPRLPAESIVRPTIAVCFGILFPLHHRLWREWSRCLGTELIRLRTAMLQHRRHFATSKSICDTLVLDHLVCIHTLQIPFANFDPQAATQTKLFTWLRSAAPHDPMWRADNIKVRLPPKQPALLPPTILPAVLERLNDYVQMLHVIRQQHGIDQQPSFDDNKRAAAITNIRQLLNFMCNVGFQLVNVDQVFKLGFEFPYALLKFMLHALSHRQLLLNKAILDTLRMYESHTNGFYPTISLFKPPAEEHTQQVTRKRIRQIRFYASFGACTVCWRYIENDYDCRVCIRIFCFTIVFDIFAMN